MKLLYLILVVGIVWEAHADRTHPVLLRNEDSYGTRIQEVFLPDLISNDWFEGKNFKVVKGKTNNAIAFDDPDQELVLKAATVYYHLSSAREFWIKSMKSSYPITLGQLVVRLEITNQFDELGHFAHNDRNPQFNNALSVPSGQTPDWVPPERHDRWNKEIWFRPMKVVDTQSMVSGMGPNPLTVALQTAEPPFIGYVQNQLTWSVLERIFYPNYVTTSFTSDVIRFAGTIAMAKVIISASKRMDPLFVEKWYYLDTALIPEVVYHEYAHVILSDYLNMSHSTPVIEGIADYFAAVPTGKRRIYHKVPGRSNSAPKDTQSKKPYRHWLESNRNATADFVLAVLWDVREVLGPEIGDQVVYEARTMLRTESATISDHLLRSILRACESRCLSPLRDKLLLFEIFTERGF